MDEASAAEADGGAVAVSMVALAFVVVEAAALTGPINAVVEDAQASAESVVSVVDVPATVPTEEFALSIELA